MCDCLFVCVKLYVGKRGSREVDMILCVCVRACVGFGIAGQPYPPDD